MLSLILLNLIAEAVIVRFYPYLTHSNSMEQEHKAFPLAELPVPSQFGAEAEARSGLIGTRTKNFVKLGTSSSIYSETSKSPRQSEGFATAN